jgi:hypothetical protein
MALHIQECENLLMEERYCYQGMAKDVMYIHTNNITNIG